MALLTLLILTFNLVACNCNVVPEEGSGDNTEETVAFPTEPSQLNKNAVSEEGPGDNGDGELDLLTENNQFKEVFGFNIAEYVRYEWDRQLPKIILQSEHEKFRALIQEMVDVNPCVETLDAYTIFLEQRVQLIEEYSAEIEDSILKVFSLR